MSASPHPPLEGHLATARPHLAEPARTTTGRSAPKDVARRASFQGSDPHPTGDGRYPVAWLHITAPRGAVPTATSKCCCGRDRSAVGRTKVLALITEHQAHRDTCTWRHPAAHETRKAS
ncbi:hypothetical protein [Streptomyces sp. CB02959]|uniref:hypothetical protein n=1 Tax=Streptomyces sp. CB02959 TaxID=2020330 RepID=UPI0021523B68|nr:hypothetical protein [Streptomyces sp. CB02959]